MDRELTFAAVVPVELPPLPDPPLRSDRIVTATIEEIAANGYERTTVEAVVDRAGVSREDFGRRFRSLEHCALDVLERVIADYEIQVGTAFNSQPDWPSALRAAAYATADWMDENPLLTTFGMVHVLQVPDEMVRVRREEAFAFCGGLIDQGRFQHPDPASIPESTATFAVGAITQLLAHRLQEGTAVEPRAVIPEMMNRVVGIYLGPEAAEAEWTAEPPPALTD